MCIPIASIYAFFYLYTFTMKIKPNGICKKELQLHHGFLQAFDALLSPDRGSESPVVHFSLLPWPLALWIWIQRIEIAANPWDSSMEISWNILILNYCCNNMYIYILYIYTPQNTTLWHTKNWIFSDKDNFSKGKGLFHGSIFRVACSCWKVKLSLVSTCINYII